MMEFWKRFKWPISALFAAGVLFFGVSSEYYYAKTQIEYKTFEGIERALQCPRRVSYAYSVEDFNFVFLVDTIARDTSVFGVLGIEWLGKDSARVLVTYQDQSINSELVDLQFYAWKEGWDWKVNVDSTKLQATLAWYKQAKLSSRAAFCQACTNLYPGPGYHRWSDSEQGVVVVTRSDTADTLLYCRISLVQWKWNAPDTTFLLTFDQRLKETSPDGVSVRLNAKGVQMQIWRKNGRWEVPKPTAGNITRQQAELREAASSI